MNLNRNKIYNTIELVICFLFVLYHLYTALFGLLSGFFQRGIHLMILMCLFYFTQIRRAKSNIYVRILSALLGLIGMCGILYVCSSNTSYEMRAGLVYTSDIVFGLMLLTSLIVAAWRGVSPSLAVIILIFILYGFFGEKLPGLLAHANLKLGRFITLTCMTTEGIFGQPLYASANQIALFVILGSIFAHTGVGNYFTSLAVALFGKMIGGPAKVSVVASGFFGSINGSAVANVVGTGTFTIPMMKSSGFDPEFAGAVEASASTGGQIMPPIMGTTAFIAAEMIGISYWAFAKAAIIPAVLYYLALIMAVDLYARRHKLARANLEDIPKPKDLLRKCYLITPILFLVALLIGFKFTIMKAGLYTLIYTIIISFISKESRINKERLFGIVRDGAKGMMSVAIACGSVGVIIAIVQGTGLSYRLSSILTVLAGENLFILLLLTMVCSIILGMGMPTAAAYTILAVLVAPALIKMGVNMIAAHMFVFYFGIISNVTPPVALAAYAAAGISKANPNKTGYKAFILSISGFILPFMFVYNPVLIGDGKVLNLIYAFATSLLGVYFLSCVTQRTFYKWNIGWFESFFMLAGALLLISPGLIKNLIGLGIFVLEIFFHLTTDKKQLTG